MTNRKRQTNSKEKQQEVVKASQREIVPPDHIELEDCYRVYFDNVISEFAKSEWTWHQLEIACLLARSISDVNEQQKALKVEGYITKRENGTTVENPRMRVVKSLTGDILSLRRSLALHARARTGDNRLAAKEKKDAINYQSKGDLDDLLGAPSYDA